MALHCSISLCAFTLGALVSLAAVAEGSVLPQVNGIRLDGDLAEAEKSGRYICRPTTAAIADTICHLKPGHSEAVFGIPVQTVLLYYYDDRLSLVHVQLEEANYGAALAGLANQYGEPSYTREEPAPRAGHGGNVRSTWLLGRAILELSRYSVVRTVPH
jgi:hypothetical protein